MPATVFEGQVKVVFCTAIADKTAPTDSEVTAGTDLTSFVTKDGYRPNTRFTRVDAATIAEVFDATEPGSTGADLELKFKSDDTTDTPRSTLGTYGTAGFVVIGHYGSAEVAGDEVTVWPVKTGMPQEANSAANEQQSWVCPFAVTSEPALHTTVVT